MVTKRGAMKLRALLDNGCQRTVVRQDIARKLGLRAVGIKRCQIQGFGGGVDRSKMRRGYQLPLDARDARGQPAGDPVLVYALAVDDIGVPVPHAPDGPWLQELRREGRILADELDAPCRDQRIDVMIGADQLRHIVFNRQKVDLSNGL